MAMTPSRGRTFRWRSVAAVVIAALTLAACQDSAEGQPMAAEGGAGNAATGATASTTESTTSPTTDTTGSSNTPPPAPVPSTSTEATSSQSTSVSPSTPPPTTASPTMLTLTSQPTSTPPAEGYPDCIYGDWIASDAWFIAALDSAGAQGRAKHVRGDVMITYSPDGTFTTNYRDWTFRVTEQGSKVTINRDGVDSGTYTVNDEGGFTMVDAALGSTITVDMAGLVMSPEPERDQQSGSFWCMGDLLQVTVDGTDLMLGRPHLFDE